LSVAVVPGAGSEVDAGDRTVTRADKRLDGSWGTGWRTVQCSWQDADTV